MAEYFKHNSETISSIIEMRDVEGMTFKAIAETMSNQLHYPFTTSSISSTYNYYKPLDSRNLDVEHMTKMLRAQKSNKETGHKVKSLLSERIVLEDILTEMKSLIQSLPKLCATDYGTVNKLQAKRDKKKGKVRNMTVEALFSDWQIGKVMDGYNTEIARRRLQEYARALIFKIKEHQESGYNVERIVLAFLGDIIESSEKHKNSARATDSSTPRQIANASYFVFIDLLIPLAELGIRLDVICVTGNHDHNDHGIQMYKPGEEHYSVVFYEAWKHLCAAQGITNITFDIPSGYYTHTDIYGHGIIYEHGVGLSVQEKALNERLHRRSQQVGKFMSMFRMGDKHNISRFSNDTLVVNGAFFGQDRHASEYSGIMGFNAPAAQIIFFHVDRPDQRDLLPIYDSFVIQLQHIK